MTSSPRMLTVTLLVCAMMALATADHDEHDAHVNHTEVHVDHPEVHVDHPEVHVNQTEVHVDHPEVHVDHPEVHVIHPPVVRVQGCKAGWVAFGNRCFKFVPTQMSWAKAQENCLAQDATLASIHSADEHQFIQGLTTDLKLPAWVGLSACQEEFHWFWTDSTVGDFKSWCPAQPDGKKAECCVQINTGGAKCWDDVPCHTANPSICVLK